jgi:hypothetical protein
VLDEVFHIFSLIQYQANDGQHADGYQAKGVAFAQKGQHIGDERQEQRGGGGPTK